MVVTEPGAMKRQRILVVALSLLALAIFMPAATDGWQDRGTFGMTTVRAENLVRDVVPGSPAGDAGIVPGDRIDIHSLTVAEHLDLMSPKTGSTLRLNIEHNGEQREVILTAEERNLSQPLRWLIVGEFASTAAFIIVGALLVFLRPVPMTWWLWLYCVGIVPINELLNFYSFVSHDVRVVGWLFGRTFLGGFSAFPLLPFVLRFPDDRISGWRAKIRWPAIAFTLVLLVYYATIAWVGLNDGLDNYSALNGIPALGIYVFAAAILLFTFVSSQGAERQRLKWVVTGMLIGFIAQIVVYIPGPAWQAPLAELISIALPISVAYAALRQRLIDVDFVINRAIVYTVMTAILIAFVSLIDFIVSHLISEYHLALYLEAGATVAVGFALDRFRVQLDHITDRLFFKDRHQAEAQLDRVARSLEFATRDSSIYEALVDEPVRWLKLASAALFKSDADGGSYKRVHSIGWSDDALAEVPDDAPIVRYLRAERTPLAARDSGWQHDGLPVGAAAPALYMPIFCRDALEGFAVYGGHDGATTLDPSEVALLADLGPRAGLAFDHLNYEVMRGELAAANERADLNEKLLGVWFQRTPSPAEKPATEPASSE